MAIEKLEKQGSVGPPRSLLDDDDKHLATNTVAHVFPFNWCLAPWVLGRSFYDKIMFGIVQYVSFCVFSLLQFLKGESCMIVASAMKKILTAILYTISYLSLFPASLVTHTNSWGA